MSGSPFVRRTEFVLVEKNIDYKLITLSREEGDLQSSKHLVRNPRGRVPVMEHGRITLYESQAIVEYIEDIFPEPSLLPTDLGDRGRMRILEMECLIYFAAALSKVAQNIFLVSSKKRDSVKVSDSLEAVSNELNRLEKHGADQGKKYLIGDKISRADFTWLPFVELVGRAGVNINSEKYVWINKWRKILEARPSYKKTFPAHW